MHIGPFPEERPAIEKVHMRIEANGAQRVGKHHKIFWSTYGGRPRKK